MTQSFTDTTGRRWEVLDVGGGRAVLSDGGDDHFEIPERDIPRLIAMLSRYANRPRRHAHARD
jgi:hypothetical protein